MKSIGVVRRINRARSVTIRRRCGNKLSLLETAERIVLEWIGHLERKSDERKVKKAYKSKVDGRKRIDRPRGRWLNKVKDILLGRG